MPEDAAIEVMQPEDLYVLPLDRFISARDGLARRLKVDGDEEGASRVASMRKPSVAAWALNRVARDDPKEVARLLESHQMLRAARSRQAVEEASRLRREMVAKLTDAATAGLGSGSQQTRDRINRTLLAVATDPEGEANLAAGTLVRELEPSGVGWGEMELPPPPPPDPSEEANRLLAEARERAEQAQERSDAADAEVERAKKALAAAKDRAKQAKSEARKAGEQLRKAEETAR